MTGQPAEEIFGDPDWMTFRSSVTLLSLCHPPDSAFAAALRKYFAGRPDHRTLRLLHPEVSNGPGSDRRG